MKILAAAVFALLLIAAAYPYTLSAGRDEMLTYYYASIDSKIPKTARALLGDERINVQIGGKTIGIETKRGELYSFELAPVENPTILVMVSNDAAEKISRGEEGLLSAADSGGIKIIPNNFFSALKVEAIKRIYAVSGADAQLTGKKSQPAGYGNTASLFVQKVKISG